MKTRTTLLDIMKASLFMLVTLFSLQSLAGPSINDQGSAVYEQTEENGSQDEQESNSDQK